MELLSTIAKFKVLLRRQNTTVTTQQYKCIVTVGSSQLCCSSNLVDVSLLVPFEDRFTPDEDACNLTPEWLLDETCCDPLTDCDDVRASAANVARTRLASNVASPLIANIIGLQRHKVDSHNYKKQKTYTNYFNKLHHVLLISYAWYYNWQRLGT